MLVPMVESIEARLLSQTRTTETEPRIDRTNVVTAVQAHFQRCIKSDLRSPEERGGLSRTVSGN